MQIALSIPIKEHYQVSIKDFMAGTIPLSKKISTNPYRQKAQHPGCYAFFEKQECLYVGKSLRSVGGRVLTHLRYSTSHKASQLMRERIKHSTNSYIKFWHCSEHDVAILETFLISTLTPLLNVEGKVNIVGPKKSQAKKPIKDQKPIQPKCQKPELTARIKAGMQKARAQGNHVGRPADKVERFLQKPKSQEILTLLRQGLKLREIQRQTGYAINTIRKVNNLTKTVL